MIPRLHSPRHVFRLGLAYAPSLQLLGIAFEVMLGEPRAECWGSAFRDRLPLVELVGSRRAIAQDARTGRRRNPIGNAAAFNASQYQASVFGSLPDQPN